MDRGVEIISTVRRRRSWTPEEKVAILAAAFSPCGSVAAASDRHDVARSLIYLWRRQAREGAIPGVGVVEPPATKFAPVRIEPSNACRTDETQQPVAKAPQSRVNGTTMIEISLTNGRTVKVRDNIDPATLARVICVIDGGGS